MQRNYKVLFFKNNIEPTEPSPVCEWVKQNPSYIPQIFKKNVFAKQFRFASVCFVVVGAFVVESLFSINRCEWWFCCIKVCRWKWRYFYESLFFKKTPLRLWWKFVFLTVLSLLFVRKTSFFFFEIFDFKGSGSLLAENSFTNNDSESLMLYYDIKEKRSL